MIFMHTLGILKAKVPTHGVCKRQKMQLVRNDDDRSFPLHQTKMKNPVLKDVCSGRQVQSREWIVLNTVTIHTANGTLFFHGSSDSKL